MPVHDSSRSDQDERLAYARYSSENQRPESIEDQVAACRRLAGQREFTIAEEHIYCDQAQSGARKDRPGLATLLSSAQGGQFQVVLVDDLSRLARDNYLMLSVLAELHFAGVRVVSVADGLDSHDEEATLGIQIRGIFNELQLCIPQIPSATNALEISDIQEGSLSLVGDREVTM